MIYASPNTDGAVVSFSERYDNFIGGDWVAPVEGAYFDNVSPVNGKPFCQVARSGAADIERALDAAHAAKDAWGRTSVADRANTLLKIADRVEANIERLAVAETWDNGKAVRETLNADLPLVVDTSATSRAASARRRAASARSTSTPWPTTSTSPSAWSARSSPGTSPC